MEKRVISLLIISSVLFLCVGILLGHFLTVDETVCVITPRVVCEERDCVCLFEEKVCPKEGDLLSRIRMLDSELTESEEDNKESRDFMRKVARELLK